MMTFTYPWILAGAAAAVIPLALHLMRREITRDLLFPSVRFIRKGPVPKKGERRLRDILLLLLRMVTLILLAVFFAAPFYPLPPAVPGADPAKTHIVLLDVSASMSAKGKQDQILAAMKALATENPNHEFHVMLSANGVVETRPALTAGSIIDHMAAIRFGTAAGDHADALRQVVRQITASPGAALTIISDFQVTDWAAEILPELPPDTPLHLVPIGSPESNLSIQSARPRREGTDGSHVQVDIRNHGPEPRSTTLSLSVGDTVVSQSITCPPRHDKTVFISLRDPTSDIAAVWLEDADFTLDNTFHLWLGEPAPRRLVAVFAETDRETAAREMYFISKALSIQPANSRDRFVMTPATTTSFFALDLGEVDGLILLGAAAHLEEPGFQQVKAFLDRGGTVFCTSSPSQPARQFIGLKRHGLLTADFHGVISEQPDTGVSPAIDSVNDMTTVGRLFANVDDSDLFFTPIRKMVRFTAYLPATAVFSTRDKDPFLVHQAVGKGDFYFLSAPLTTDWTELPVSMSFLPMIQEIFTPGTASQGVLSLVCGEGLPSRRDLSGKEISLAAPGWENRAFDAPPQAGSVGLTPVEINVSRRESSLLTRPLTAVRLALTGSPWDRKTAVTATVPPEKRDLRPPIALALLAALLLETLLASGLFTRRE
ncbi:MAG: BatA domain-containing protein [Lentisphaeria bacterium]|nr:BatA domain-containing protein [Lentisphaeria bacterium]